MKDNRREFLKKSTSLAAVLSIGGLVPSLANPIHKKVQPFHVFNGLTKDAGMELSCAYFWGMDEHRQLIELAKQMGTLGAIAGIDGRLYKNTGAKPWEYKAILQVKEAWKQVGLNYNVVEGPPSLGNKTKLGLEGRDEEIENFITFMKNLKKVGVDVICYNWMPVISWARTVMDRKGRGGALVTEFNNDNIKDKPLTKYGEVTKEKMWKNLEYFLKAVVSEAEKIEMKLALHPDDPQVHHIQGISRIMNTVENFDKMLNIMPSKYNGVTMCQGNFSLMGADIPTLVRRWGIDKIHFVHFRNVQDLSGVLPSTRFTETFHDIGQIDMYKAMEAYYDIGFRGAIRADHVPTMAGEENTHPGYMTLGNLYALGYIRGLAESVSKAKNSTH